MATLQSSGTFGPRRYTFEELAEAAHNFSNRYLLGEGGFGQVYQGFLDGQTFAIKKLSYLPDQQKKKKLEHEISVISSISHRNLVKLVGYCFEEQNALLVLEYFPNKSLKVSLHEKKILDWPKRMKIAMGSAKGLEYLHENCKPRIIHQDIKSDNILLDENFEPKVADFGLAEFFPDAVSHVSTSIKGTKDYIDPQYSGELSDKSDVYSFGVVLLELITGRKSTYEDVHIVGWAKPRIIQALKGEYMNFIDSNLQKYDRREMRRMIFCAASCVYKPLYCRPAIKKIVRALEEDKWDILLKDIWNDNDYNFLNNPNVELPQTTVPKLPNNVVEPRRKPTMETSTTEETSSSGSVKVYKPRSFTYRELAKATAGFSPTNILGQGVFGVVYKGLLPREVIVAIKKLKDLPNKQPKEEFEKKIKDISSVNHSNIVNPMGYCIDKNLNRLLVLEYVPSSNSLKYHLHSTRTLDWPKRMKIAIGSAKGLKYLHEGKIIHGDMKTNNIILDNNFDPKVTNFGLIMFFQPERTDVYADIQNNKKASEKSDVYAFGVVLLELITGRSINEKGGNIINWARTRIQPAMNGQRTDLFDLKLQTYDESQMKQMIYCAAACVYKPLNLRPQMKKIVEALEALEGHIPPKNIWDENDNKFLHS
ncbi:cold-responsive protein kinase 1-like isoform X1 [Hevea brasiliensis]|uniref:cold-responsive protein kinase 1-like isoform X1 n=1 Tax=Hevea brasiliensis TaxID=3981 RepID=UPI0025D8FBF8|nr:cold-responsive protein kinase 1-like isoform X1 [Hevea brasiliensis]